MDPELPLSPLVPSRQERRAYPLHRAAMRGDDVEVRRLVDLGEDVNALDSVKRTVLGCAVVGENFDALDTLNTSAPLASPMSPARLNVLRILLKHPDVSLYTLNAPQQSMKGTTPLGMAAWLDAVECVRVLLEESSETVSVDGMDAHGVTALMYAARDGGLEVVQQLLSHGARPDFRDANHRTSIQFSLPHPQILWLCEVVLRRHRWRESQSPNDNSVYSNPDQLLPLVANSLLPLRTFAPPPLSLFAPDALLSLTNILIQAIRSTDRPFLYSLIFPSPPPPPSLYPPLLVNRPDSRGWSPIHYCVSLERPSLDVLDALYCAGADVSLFTAHEHFTPLHCLAYSARQPTDQFAADSSYLYEFAVHLIRNLHAPLSARDKHEETCIHVAAEHGESLDLLLALLDCDASGYVRKLRNDRGMTPLEVAKPEFHAAFGADADKLRPASRVSVRTIRPTSYASVSSLSHPPHSATKTSRSRQQPVVNTVDFPSDFGPIQTSNKLLSHLRLTCPSFEHDPSDLDHLDVLLHEAALLNVYIVRHFRACTEEAARELREARTMGESLGRLLDAVGGGLQERLSSGVPESSGLELAQMKKRHRESEDSQLTVVSTDSGYLEVSDYKHPLKSSVWPAAAVERRSVAVGMDLPLVDVSTPGSASFVWPEWLDLFIAHADSTAYNTHLGSNMPESPTSETPSRSQQLLTLDTSTDPHALSSPRRKQGKWHVGGLPTSKWKAWFKRKILHDRPYALEIVWEIEDGARCCVGREVKMERPEINIGAETVGDNAWRQFSYEMNNPTFRVALAAASRDLERIHQSASSVDHLIETSRQYISRAERITHRAIKKRENHIAELRLRTLPNSSFDSDFYGRPPDSTRPPGGIRNSSHTSSRSCTANTRFTGSSSACSARSSRYSIASTITEGGSGDDDDDTRVLRRLLLRKIEASVCGALDEIDKVTSWLRILKETVRGVKRRAYL